MTQASQEPRIAIAVSTRALRVAGLFLAGAAVLGLAAVTSAHPGPVASGVIHSCVNASNPGADATAGAIRVVDATATCKSNERPMDWNAQGIQGPKGDKGDKGDTGPQGPSGVAKTTARYKALSVSPGENVQGVVSCETGELVTGGGASGATYVKVNSSIPYPPAPGAPDGWFVHATNNGTVSTQVNAWVICAAG